MTDDQFKVIVIGGGPVGLTAAHALSRAGIDYIVLEQRSSIAIDVGASLVLWPQGLRVLAQLDLLESLQAIGSEVGRTTIMTHGAYKYKEARGNEIIKKNHGIQHVAFHRAHFLDVLYDKLEESDKARILTDKKVADILSDVHGVVVRCGDGSTYRGSIIIGADGAHSMVRRKMRDLALESAAEEVNEEKPYLSEYRALWCTFPRQPSVQPGDSLESHGTDVSLQCLNGDDRSWIFIYERLSEPTRGRVSYSEEDVEALATRYGELPVAEGIRVKDVFPKRYTAGMANLEEGIVQHWSWNRFVLVGDACHKLTPNQGLGYNNGIQDIVALINELHNLVASGESEKPMPTLSDLTKAFSRYQDVRMTLLQKDFKSSAGYTRMSAWRNWMLVVLDRYVLPSIPGLEDLLLTRIVGRLISKALVFDYLESSEPFQGTISWEHAMKSSGMALPSHTS